MMEIKTEAAQRKRIKYIRVYIYRNWVNVEIWDGDPHNDSSELLDEYYVLASYVHVRYKPTRSITIMYPRQYVTFTQDQQTRIEVEDRSRDYIECYTSE